MKRISVPLLALLLVGLARGDEPAPGPEREAALPTARRDSLRDFRLADLDGRNWTLADLREARLLVLAWTAPGCPIAMVEGPRLAALAAKLAERGVRFLGVDSNAGEDLDDLRAHARRHGLSFPVLADSDGTLAERLGVVTTATVVLLDENRRVRYRGALDDQYGVGGRKTKPTRRWLEEAVEAVLADRAVEIPETEAPGCEITLASARPREVPASAPTWSDGVGEVVHRRCAACHAPGQGGPFALLEWRDASRRAAVLREVISEDRMPPWSAAGPRGVFANDRRLAPEEKATLLAWLEAGAPEGDPDRAPPPPAPRNAEGWEIGTPDAVLEFPAPEPVPAEGVVPYRFVEVPTDFPEDRWVVASEVAPGDPGAVHHALVALSEPGRRRGRRGLFLPTRGFFAAMVPGGRAQVYPPGTGKRLPKGASLLFQMHYTPYGVATTDRTRIALRFAKETPAREVFTSGAFQPALQIPPGVADHPELAMLPVPFPVEVLAFMPHMHLRGKSARFEIQRPDGRRETILDVPRYDFNWQTPYRYAVPPTVPAGSVLLVHATFDNSPANPYNPDPSAVVTWGDQTWEEMLIGYVDYLRVP